MTRRYLTKREKSALYEKQEGICACGCGEKFPIEEMQGEHYTPVAFGNDQKPDALWAKEHHKKKTASDIKKIWKVKRLRGETKTKPKRSWAKGRKLESRNTLSKEHRQRAKEWREGRGLS